MARRRVADQIALMTLLGKAVSEAIGRQAKVRQFGRLAESFRFLPRRDSVTIFSTYYWVRFVNDGRPAINLRAPKQMIFFKDPFDDPRISDDYPKRRATRRKLTQSEFIKAREDDLLVVTRSVAAVPPSRFIEAGIREARTIVPALVLEAIRGDVRSFLRRRRDKVTVNL